MPTLIALQQLLLDTSMAIAQVEKGLVSDPLNQSLLSMARSLSKRQQDLDTEYQALASQSGLDVCSYRIITDRSQLPVNVLGKALSGFQQVVSVVFDAITNGPKIRARLSPEIAAQSTFNFGYSFAGSTGIVLTVPNDRLLMIDSTLDMAIRSVFLLSKAKTSDQILTLANEVGVASIRALYDWAKAHAAQGLSAEVLWKRESTVRARVLVQQPEFEELERTISATSTEEEETITLFGSLVGADVVRRTFRFQVEGAADIRGEMSPGITEAHAVELPKLYTATILKRTRTQFSTDQEEINYTLLRLQ